MALSFASVTTWLASVRKSLVVAVGGLVTVLTVYHQLPFLPDQAYVVAVLAALTTLATYLTPNKS